VIGCVALLHVLSVFVNDICLIRGDASTVVFQVMHCYSLMRWE